MLGNEGGRGKENGKSKRKYLFKDRGFLLPGITRHSLIIHAAAVALPALPALVAGIPGIDD